MFKQTILDENTDDGIQISCLCCFDEIVQENPQLRLESIQIIEEKLSKFENNDESLNAFLINSLMDLQAKESINLIRQAFKAEKVEIQIIGDLEDVEIELGLRSQRETPKPHYGGVFGKEFTGLMDQLFQRTEELKEDFTEEIINSTVPLISEKIARNEPCPCGSGKKYKKCCINKDN